MKGRAIHYSIAELAWLEEHRLLVISDYHSRFVATFSRDEVTLPQLHALRKRRGWLTGRTGRFVPGQVPPNKGKKMPFNANSAATRFKKGNRTGEAQRKYQPIGTERITKDGYIQRKVHDDLPMQSRWQLVQRIEWSKVNGPIPKDHALKCLDGNKANTDPSNWELVPRALLPRLNGRFGRNFDTAPAELKPTIMAIAKLEHRARTAS